MARYQLLNNNNNNNNNTISQSDSFRIGYIVHTSACVNFVLLTYLLMLKNLRSLSLNRLNLGIQSFGLDIQIFVFEVLRTKFSVLGLDALIKCQVLGLGLEAQVLGLGLEAQVHGLGLEAQVLGHGLGLETQVLGLGLETQVLVNITANQTEIQRLTIHDKDDRIGRLVSWLKCCFTAQFSQVLEKVKLNMKYIYWRRMLV